MIKKLVVEILNVILDSKFENIAIPSDAPKTFRFSDRLVRAGFSNGDYTVLISDNVYVISKKGDVLRLSLCPNGASLCVNAATRNENGMWESVEYKFRIPRSIRFKFILFHFRDDKKENLALCKHIL